MESSFKAVFDLMIKEQFINSCSKELSVHLMERKLKSLRDRELVIIAEQYLTVHNKKLANRDFKAEKSACAPRLEVKNTDASFETGGIKCFNCRNLRHRASECFLRVHDKGRKKYCYRCEEIGHTFMRGKKSIIT